MQNKCQIGIQDQGGSFYTDVHVLFSATGTPTKAEFEASKGFLFAGGGVVMCDQCYSDSFGKAFEIGGTCDVFINNSMCFWYMGVATAKVIGFNVVRANPAYKIRINNFELVCPSADYGVDFAGLVLPNYEGQYAGVYEGIQFDNMNITNTSTYENGGVLKNNDWITCRAFYNRDSINLRDAWVTTMTANAWYPIAYIRSGTSNFRLRMANDQCIEATVKVGQSSSISVKNVFNNSHEGEYEIGLCNVAQDENNIYGGILCVRATASVCGYNPCLYSGLQAWNTQIFTRRSFMGVTPLVSPTVDASSSFNPS